MVCDQVWASFNAPTYHLQLLLIMGLGRYRWSLDFASPLNLTLNITNMFWLWSNIFPSG
jgi:hypothetical protein